MTHFTSSPLLNNDTGPIGPESQSSVSDLAVTASDDDAVLKSGDTTSVVRKWFGYKMKHKQTTSV